MHLQQAVNPRYLTLDGHTIVGWEKTGKKMKIDPMATKKKPKANAGAAAAAS